MTEAKAKSIKNAKSNQNNESHLTAFDCRPTSYVYKRDRRK
jgi:hypothetical protein